MTEDKKFQWSKFSPDRTEQIVIRTDDEVEFDTLITKYKEALPKSHAFPNDEGDMATPESKVQEEARDFCKMHNCRMKLRPQGFYSHATQYEDGTWHYCKGKGFK